jgi:hypothetical protein
MPSRPVIYGDESHFKRALARHAARGRDLLGQAERVRNDLSSAPGGEGSLRAQLAEQEWTDDVERWRTAVFRTLRQRLGAEARRELPQMTMDWPPNTGKPRHARRIEWVEPWLLEGLGELEALRDLLGVRRGVAAASPPSARFAELHLSGLVQAAVIEGLAGDMNGPRTPHQLANAIGAAKELTEATLRAALDRMGEPWRDRDELALLMRKWRSKVEAIAPPDAAGRENLDKAQAALANVVVFLTEWRNDYGRGHGRPAYPPGLKARHARLAVDSAETAIRFVVLTMDDLERLPPEEAASRSTS